MAADLQVAQQRFNQWRSRQPQEEQETVPLESLAPLMKERQVLRDALHRAQLKLKEVANGR